MYSIIYTYTDRRNEHEVKTVPIQYPSGCGTRRGSRLDSEPVRRGT